MASETQRQGDSGRRPEQPKTVLGRDRELATLGRLAESLHAGSSETLVVHGPPGIGKTTILARFVETQRSSQIISCAGVESEMELPWAGLHQVCLSLMDHLPKIPGPQSAALGAAFGLAAEGQPDPFICGLAVLSLMAEAAEDRPLICVIDDAYALDQASLQTLAFASRRLRTESVGLVFAVREIPAALVGLPDLAVAGLKTGDAAQLFDAVGKARLDPPVRDRIIAETSGNPLAILELTEQGHVSQLAGGYGVPWPTTLTGRIEESFVRTADGLDPDTRQLLLLAAADPTGDGELLRRAARSRGLAFPHADDAALARLISFSTPVRFRHPLVRSAIYAAATDADRRAAHRALADGYVGGEDADRRIWHLAQSVDSPDYRIADALEHAAAGAQARGGWAAAAAFLARSAQLTPDAEVRAARELAAATARFQSGNAPQAMELLAAAEAGGLGDRMRAHAQLLRAQIAFYLTRGGRAPADLLEAARALRSVDPELSRETYLEAVMAAVFAERLAVGETLRSISRAAMAEAPAIEHTRPSDVLLDAEARVGADGSAAATPAARAAIAMLSGDATDSPLVLRSLWIGVHLAYETFDDRAVLQLGERGVDVARRHGMVMSFGIVSTLLGGLLVMSGDLAGGNALFEEATAVSADAGNAGPPWPLCTVFALRGDQERFEELAEPLVRQAHEASEGHVLISLRAVSALLHNSFGRYRAALDDCRWALDAETHSWLFLLAFEYIEAAGRGGSDEERAEASRYIAALTAAADTGWGRGLRAMGRAMLDDEPDPEASYRESIEGFRDSTLVLYLGRAHLLLGEWLRRGGRRQEGRQELRAAHSLLLPNGYEAFAARAARELGLAGDKRQRRPPTREDELTPQELQVAQMAAAGLSNREIAERMYLSYRTVASHLYRVYPKLGISSRSQLHLVLNTDR